MSRLADLMEQGRRVAEHRPFPRVVVDEGRWRQTGARLADGSWTLFGFWGDPEAVHVAVHDQSDDAFGVISYECVEGMFPSLSAQHKPAIRLERAIRDVWGHEPQGAPDDRPWLDHGRWDVRHPLGDGAEHDAAGAPYEFLAAEGESLHQIPVGPVHAGIIEPGHFRFSANGEAVVRLEERLGYVHKGIEALMGGASIEWAAKLATRTSGDSMVAYALAFARATEAATEADIPPRAHWLRALLGEIERLANHLGDIGAVCNDAAFALMLAHCGVLREQVLRAADACFGHRLMRDLIVPGGVARDLDEDGTDRLLALMDDIRSRFPALVELYDNTASLQQRTVNTGTLRGELAREFGAGGYVGRASGRAFDARRSPGYAPYDSLNFDVPVMESGDVNARVWIRIREVEQSLALIEQILRQLPKGPVRAELPANDEACEGMAIVEGFRGDVLVWLRLGADGNIERCHLRDPSWFQWPLLEAVIEGEIVADFPLCNKSFNCSYSGHDL